MNQLRLLAAALVLGAASPAPAQTAPANWRGVTGIIDRSIAETGFPGLTAAVVRDGRIEYLRGFGLSDVENGTPAGAETVYRIASISKPITAVAVLQLLETRRIALDASIRAYVPELPAAYDRVTIRDLLRHTGGVRHYKEDSEFITTRRCERLADALAIFAADPLDHDPGAKITYSTWGYTLLGVAIEKASGESYVDYVRKHVFEPAGMASARVDSLAIIPNRSAGYTSEKDGIRNADPLDTSCRIPAGGFVSTAGDLARFAVALETGRLLKPAMVAEMTTSQITPEMVLRTVEGMTIPEGYEFPGFGLGWAIEGKGKEIAVHHGGNQPGATTMLYTLPRRRLAIVLLTNLDSKGGEITQLAKAIAAAVP